MAEGILYGLTGLAVPGIETCVVAYKWRTGHAPACVRVRAETLGANPPAEVAGVKVIADETVQPGHVMCCEGVEE